MRRKVWLSRVPIGVVVLALSACAQDPARVVSAPDQVSTDISSADTVRAVPAAPTTNNPTTEPPTTEPPTTEASPADPPVEVSLHLVCDGILLPGDSADLSSLPPMDDDAERAWDGAAAKYGVDMRGDRDWRILERTDTSLQLIGAVDFGDGSSDSHFVIASFSRSGDAWSAENVTNCDARWGANGRLNVDWLEFDPAHRAASDESELQLVFGDDTWPCGSGDADAVTTVVKESDDAVSIVVLVAPSAEPDHACTTGLRQTTVHLDEPLGARTVLDASTEPPRPLTLFRPEQRLHVALAGGAVLGWWDADAGTWVDDDATSPALPVSPGTEFAVVALDGPRPSVRAGSVVRDCEPAQTWTVMLNPAIDWGQQTLAVDAEWPLLPRPVTTMSTTIAEYEEAVRALLADRGLADVPLLVEQIVRVDLDGDGTDEVLVAARHPDTATSIGAEAGFYSVVLLRRVVGAGVETTVLFEDIHLEADVDFPSMQTGQVMAVGDLNGDGTMEVALQWQYFEGGGVDIFDAASGSPQKVLTTACGS